MATSLCGLVILGTDTLIATALFHTCGHFRVLQQEIKNISTENDVSIFILEIFCTSSYYYKLIYLAIMLL